MNEYRCYINAEGQNYLVKEKELAYQNRLASNDHICEFMEKNYRLSERAEEYAYLIAGDIKMNPIAVFEISHGTVQESLVSNRDLFVKLLLCGASSFVLVHNHPSGIPDPSTEDKTLTKRVNEGAQLMGLYFADHIIIGRSGVYSFRGESGLL